MESSDTLSPFSSPLSSPSKTPHSSPQKASKPLPTSSPSQRHSPERQCACPCRPFKAELKSAITLMTFIRHPAPALVSYPYPSDSITNQHIPVDKLIKYSKTHVWPDGIRCFCSLRPDSKAHSVRIFIPSQGPMQGSPCLGCMNWTPDGVGGCRYFVDLKALFEGSEALFGTDVIRLQSFPLHDKKTGVRRLLASSGAHPPEASLLAPAAAIPGPSASLSGPSASLSGPSAPLPHPSASLPGMSAPSPIKPSALGVHDYFPLVFGVKPGSITDPERIWSPPTMRDVLDCVETAPLPTTPEVKEVFDEMVNGSGVPYRRFMSVIGGCIVCDQVMALPNILTHTCIGRTKETGPCPSKYPLPSADRRTLPAAGSVIKKEPGASQGAIKKEPDAEQGAIKMHKDDDIEFVINIGVPTRKHKVNFSTVASQRVLVSPIKKPRIANNSKPSQMTSISAQPAKTDAEIIDLTGSPVRIPTPESSRDVYRDWDEEFIMYKKA